MKGPDPYLLHQCFYWFVGPDSQFPTLLYPIFNHYGYLNSSSATRTQCSCPMTDDMSYCNVFDLLSQFIVYSNSSKYASPEAQLAPLLKLVAEYTDRELTEAVYKAYTTSDYSFCETEEFGACSIISFRNYADFEHEITNTFFQVPFG
jgi:hypothetical protein